MILPLALTDRSPEEYYTKIHSTTEAALKHSMSDLLNLHYEIERLNCIEQTEMGIPDEYFTKEGRLAYKRLGDESHTRQFIQYVIEKKEQYDLLIKNLDYPALIMASYQDAKFLSKSKFWDNAENIIKEHPVLLRGISSGKIADFVRSHNQDYYFIETGYLGNYRSANNRTGRKVYHRIVKNAMQHNKIMDVPDDRWRALVKFNPDLAYHGWKKPGSKILVVLSTHKPFDYYKQDQEKWLEKVVKTLKKHTDREIIFREKDRRGNRTEKDSTIYDAMDNDIYAVVTYNSIAAVEAIQYGIPAFALAPTAAAPVCSNDLKQIENPVMPSEDIIYKWLSSIAYGQFSLEEMLTGQAWKMVLENNKRPTFDY